MSEYMADAGWNFPLFLFFLVSCFTGTNQVNEEIINLYKYWALSKTSMLITGNIHITREFMEAPTNVCVVCCLFCLFVVFSYSFQTLEDMDDKLHFALLKRWADVVNHNGSMLIAQISHPGRQCKRS